MVPILQSGIKVTQGKTFCQSPDWKMHPTNEPRKERPVQLDHVFVVTKSSKHHFFATVEFFLGIEKNSPH